MGKIKYHNIDFNNELIVLTYNSWRSMRNRCLFDNNNNKYHKKRGITICDEWIDNFECFLQDMGVRPSKSHTLDRIDVNGDYEPDNCRWATYTEQANNKRNNVYITYNDITHTIAEWGKILNLSKTELNKAYKRYVKYNAKTFEEIFCKSNLLQERVSNRPNKCKICGTEESCKWRKNGQLCNTCYARAFRWAKINNKKPDEYKELKDIKWK